MYLSRATNRFILGVFLLVCGVLTASVAPASASKVSEPDTVLEQLELLNIRAMRMAIEDIGQSFPGKYASESHLKRLDTIEKRLHGIKNALAQGDESVLDEAGKILAFQREALLANPLLNFDRLLLVKRSAKQLGLPQNWQGNCAVPSKGYDNEIAVLSPIGPSGKLTTFFRPSHSGFVGDIDLSFDAK